MEETRLTNITIRRTHGSRSNSEHVLDSLASPAKLGHNLRRCQAGERLE